VPVVQAGSALPFAALADNTFIRISQAFGGLLALLLLAAASPAKADEVTAESMIDQASALRDASSRVPKGAHIQGSDCTEIALPGLSFRYRCSVRFTPASPVDPKAPGGGTAKP